MRDFVIVKCDDMWGYISTDREQKHGFEENYTTLMKKLEKYYGKFTYAENGELALFEGQREFTQRDKLYARKLMHHKMNFDIQQALFMSRFFNER